MTIDEIYNDALETYSTATKEALMAITTNAYKAGVEAGYEKAKQEIGNQKTIL